MNPHQIKRKDIIAAIKSYNGKWFMSKQVTYLLTNKPGRSRVSGILVRLHIQGYLERKLASEIYFGHVNVIQGSYAYRITNKFKMEFMSKQLSLFEDQDIDSFVLKMTENSMMEYSHLLNIKSETNKIEVSGMFIQFAKKIIRKYKQISK
jgi:ABC-type thiamin/hydroxymethylpyrimidine transport system permease subunit